jgi:chromosome segregation ATPase
MKCILEKKRQLLLHKNKEIKELAKQNSFLNSVLSDYEKIKSRILEEKQKQQTAIKIISKHISQISKNMNKEDHYISELQDDQSMLLEELEKIKMEMNEVMRS